jgi:hypothetical protein
VNLDFECRPGAGYLYAWTIDVVIADIPHFLLSGGLPMSNAANPKGEWNHSRRPRSLRVNH